MSKRKKKVDTPGMRKQRQVEQMQAWAKQGIEIIEVLQEPPKNQGHNELLKRVRAAASIPFYSAVSFDAAITIVSTAVNAAYWIGKGASLSELNLYGLQGTGNDAEEPAD